MLALELPEVGIRLLSILVRSFQFDLRVSVCGKVGSYRSYNLEQESLAWTDREAKLQSETLT